MTVCGVIVNICFVMWGWFFYVLEVGLGVVLPDVFVWRERVVQGHDNFEILPRFEILCCVEDVEHDCYWHVLKRRYRGHCFGSLIIGEVNDYSWQQLRHTRTIQGVIPNGRYVPCHVPLCREFTARTARAVEFFFQKKIASFPSPSLPPAANLFFETKEKPKNN